MILIYEVKSQARMQITLEPHYNMVNFLQNKATPQLANKGEVCGVFCEFTDWPVFYITPGPNISNSPNVLANKKLTRVKNFQNQIFNNFQLFMTS